MDSFAPNFSSELKVELSRISRKQNETNIYSFRIHNRFELSRVSDLLKYASEKAGECLSNIIAFAQSLPAHEQCFFRKPEEGSLRLFHG